ncbi:MAG: hypothetical protein ACRC30_08365 [Clostridium sp.]
MVKELVKMDLRRMALMLIVYSFIGLLLGGTGTSNFVMFILGMNGITMFLESRKSDKFLNVLPVDRKEILKSQILTSFIMIGIFSIIFIITFFLGQYKVGYIVQSLGVVIVMIGIVFIKVVEFNIEENNIGIVLKNIHIILPLTLFILIIVTEKSAIYVFNIFLIISIGVLLVWFLSFGRKYYRKLKIVAK